MRRTRRLTVVVTVVACFGAGSLAAFAVAQTTPPAQTTTSTTDTTTTTAPSGPTVAIDNCHVRHSRAQGGFTWAYCGIVTDTTDTTDTTASGSITVDYRINLPVFRPSTGGTWQRHRTGTLLFTGGGAQLLNIKFAIRNRSVSQVRQSLRVTLSDAQGATLTDATARPVLH